MSVFVNTTQLLNLVSKMWSSFCFEYFFVRSLQLSNLEILETSEIGGHVYRYLVFY